jgi:nicotinamidase-related amidase
MACRIGDRSALLVVDVQVGVVARAWERGRTVGNMALAVRRAREAGAPVIWVQHEDEELRRGTPDWEWVPELVPLPGEPRVYKQYNSAFEETELPALLDRLGIGRIVLAGAATNWCIRATAYGALDRGFDLTLVGDAHTTVDMEPEPGRPVLARAVVDDLNTTLRWLSYPGRTSAVALAAEVDFASPP